jgi:hypothetical protein
MVRSCECIPAASQSSVRLSSAAIVGQLQPPRGYDGLDLKKALLRRYRELEAVGHET